MSDSYKIYASKDYVDSKALPEGATAHQMLVTDAEGVAKWDDRLFGIPVIGEPVESFTTEVSNLNDDGVAYYTTVDANPTDYVENANWAGKSYAVIINGETYENVTVVYNNFGGMIYGFGNASLYFGDAFEDTGEPFFWLRYGGMSRLVTKTAGTYEFALAEKGITKLPAEAMPSVVPVIQSASVGQTVVVSAVDEDGKPTEWETTTITIPDNELYFFNATISDDLTTFSTQTTFEEINREYKSGKEVICKALYMNGEIQFNIISVMVDNLFIFGANMLDTSMSVSITADNEISITNDTIMLLSNLNTGLLHYEVVTRQDMKGYATNEEMEAAIAAIPQPDMNDYYTKTEIDNKGYLTEHQDISGKADKSGWTPNMIIGTDANGDLVARATYTEAEKQEMMQEIIDSIKVQYPEAHVIYGDVDENNVITLHGDLSDDTYTWMYEHEDGSITKIGTTEFISYTNQIPISTDTDGSIFNTTGYKESKRIGSSGTESDLTNPTSATKPPFITGFIPCKQGDVIRLKNCYIPTEDGSNDIAADQNSYGSAFWGIRSGLYDASKAKITVFSWGMLYENDLTIVKDYTSVNGKINQFTIAQSGVSYIRITLATDTTPADAILTVNEEIA